MAAPVDLNSSSKAAFDGASLNGLKNAAKENSPEALKAVAKQFEAIFMNMMLKSMREASTGEGVLDNEQTKMFTGMLDQQLTQSFSEKGLGLADVLVRQLSKISGVDVTELKKNQPSSPKEPVINQSNPDKTSLISNAGNAIKQYAESATSSIKNSAQSFAKKMQGFAEEASKSSGIPTNFMVGQAALESGWGKKMLKGADGVNSHNLFGIKATADWKGKTIEAHTTEYEGGVKKHKVEKFRAYDSYAESFKDFASLLQKNPRYQSVMKNLHDASSFASEMQKSGYATDPKYGEKLAGVIRKVGAS